MSERMNELMNERNNIMKKIMMIVVMVAAVVLPTMAQQFRTSDQPQTEFQSTSTMQTSGSAYASQPMLNADGTAYNPAAAVTPMPDGPRRSKENPNDPGNTTDNGSPIGDAVLPLMIMALAFGGVIYLRRRKAVNR